MLIHCNHFCISHFFQLPNNSFCLNLMNQKLNPDIHFELLISDGHTVTF
jgi:hypothetical protein